MGNILTWIGSLFGYIVQFFYLVFRNYGVAIILFTVFSRLLLMPSTISQQKNQAKTARIQPKLDALKRQYGNSREHQMEYNQAVQELYEKEGISMTGGCLPMLIQFPLILGLYRAITMPLTCVLHLGKETVALAQETFCKAANNFYNEIEIIEHIRTISREGSVVVSSTDAAENVIEHVVDKAALLEVFGDKTDRIIGMSNSFNFLGIDLLSIPKFWNVAVIMSFIVFIVTAGSMYITNKMTPTGNQQMQKGCMKLMPLSMAAMSTWFSFRVPAALALYWAVSSAISPAQTYFVQTYYGTGVLNAKAEAQRHQTIVNRESEIIREITAKKGRRTFAPVYETSAARDEKKDKQENRNNQKKKNKGKRN